MKFVVKGLEHRMGIYRNVIGVSEEKNLRTSLLTFFVRIFSKCERYVVNQLTFSCFNYVTKIRRTSLASLTHTARKYFGNQRSNENSNMTKTRTPTLEHRYEALHLVLS